MNFRIDEKNIKEECKRLASDCFIVLAQQRLAREALAKCKNLLNLTIAEVSLKVREELKDVKTTEAIISSVLETKEEVKKVREDLRLAEAKVKECDVVVECMNVKREQLTNLVKLINNESYLGTVTMGGKQ